ncbi:MAG TPA: peptidase M19 [Clostridium sp.]|nr:peptidase M19 [Clostridium sp.]
MNFIDLHCDTAGRMYYEKLNLKESICKVDIDKLKSGNCLAQVFAIFVDQKLNTSSFDEFMKIYNNFINEVSKNSNEIQIVKNIPEMNKVHKEGKIATFLSIEEGEVLEGKIENLKKVYDLGIRILTVTWNYKNKLGYPNFKFKYQNEGLTEKGIEVISECERLGIIPDASHLSDGGFYNLIKICKKPFIASHSNARAVTNHPRNLTDYMIKLLANKGGIMGLNFCSDFLGKDSIASIEEIVRHAKHIKNVGGIDVLCLGSDFDGILNEVEIENASQFDKLYDGLKSADFTDDEIEKVFYKNVLRVFSETL